MPTDDVNNADETPRASQPAAENSSEPEQLRAMSLSDLEPDTDEDAAPRRMTRREARARRQHGGDDASLPVSTRVGGAFRSRRSKQHAPDENDASSAQAPDEAEAPAADRPHEAPDAPADDIDDDTRANPIATSTPAAAAGAAPSSGQGDSAPSAATTATEEDLTHVAAPEGPEASEASDGTSQYEPEPTVAMPVAEVSTVAMDATMVDPDGPAADEQRDEAPSERPALAWVSTADIVANDRAPRKPKNDGEPEPLVRQRRRSAWPVLAPILTAVVLAGVYVGSCAAWPLDNVTPTVEKVTLESPEGPALEPQWPDDGGAAVAAVGHTGDVASSSSDERPMASITKLVSVLMVLDQQPLESGEQGPSYAFTWDDQNAYWGYASRGESRLEVPVDGSLTQYQMLQGVLLGSANNWIDRLVIETFGSIEEFAAQAPAWLEDNGLTSMTVVQPSGIDWDNTSSPADVARLGALALEHPVVAEIVQQKEVELPGAGLVENSNPLIDDEGVVGLKTGTLLNNSNLVVAKEVDSEGETVTVVASILGQPDNVGRVIVARTLL
ncbi:MAG: D-alanyl-D-alanine carboxypeptidase family protein, partial [Microbacterium sp.]